MPKDNGKYQFTSQIRKQGGSYVTTVPPEIVDHNDLEEDDEIQWQTEWYEDHDKPYTSTWNGTKHDINEQGDY